MNIIWRLALVLSCLAMARSDDARESAKKVQAGVNAASAIIDVMADQKLSRNFGNFGKIASNLSPFLGALGPAISLITMFLPTAPSAELQYMKTKFAEMDAKFDQTFNQFYDVKNLIRQTALKTQYAPYEHTILSLSAKLRQMLAAPLRHTDVYKRSFIRQYESDYDGAADKIWRGMMTNAYVLSDNILREAMQYTKNHRRRVQNVMKGVMNLIMQGVKVELGYLSLSNLTRDYNVLQGSWENKIKQLVNHMEEIDGEVLSKWYSQMTSDLYQKLADWDDISHNSFGTKLYNFLVSKYEWRYWHVVVYDPVRGGDKHWVKSCGGKIIFRTHGRNLVVSSVDQSKKPININYATQLLRSTSTEYHGFWGVRHDRDAKDVYKRYLDTELRDGCNYAGVGVIRRTASIIYRGPSNRKTYVWNNAYLIHAFG